jgi:beta-glucosidase
MIRSGAISSEGYLESIGRAVKEDGIDVRSYFAWTFTDNWEWAAGYTDRYVCFYISSLA